METRTSSKTGKVLLLLGRLALAGIFIFAAYAKMKPQAGGEWSSGSVRVSLAMFAMQVDSYQLLSPAQVNFVAHTLPPFELFLGLWLLSGVLLPFSALITTLLLSGFFGTMVRSYRMGLEINCGCFGPGERLGPLTLLRDGSLLALAIAVTVGAFWMYRKRAASKAAPASADVAVGAAG